MVATCRAAAVLSCLLLATAASAQVTTGDIVGRVTDESGAVLPGATVTVDNVGTHEIRTTVTSATGLRREPSPNRQLSGSGRTGELPSPGVARRSAKRRAHPRRCQADDRRSIRHRAGLGRSAAAADRL